ncbi:MAG: lipopolysaccharide assembly protein LapA domain-containing protein [bacterium]
MKLLKKLALIMLIAVIAVLISFFAKVNDRYVTLDLICITIESIQIWLLVLFSFLAGAMITVVLVAIDIVKINYSERKLKKQIKTLKKELAASRSGSLDEITGEQTESIVENESLEPKSEVIDNFGDDA